MQTAPFDIGSDFSKELMKKYKRLLREETRSPIHQHLLEDDAAPDGIPRPSSNSRRPSNDLTQELQSFVTSEVGAQPVARDVERLGTPVLQLNSPLRDRPKVSFSSLHTEKRSEKPDNSHRVVFDRTERDLGSQAELYPMENSTTDILKAEHASIVRALKQRAQEQIMQAHKERDMAINEARESSLTYMQKIDQLESLLMAKDNAIKNLQGDMGQLKDLYDARQQSMIDRQVVLEQENARLKDEVRSLNTRVDQIRDHERATLEERVKLATDANLARVESLENKLRLAERTISSLERDKLAILQETAKDVTEMNKCHEELKDRYSELVLACKKLKQRVVIATSERNALKEENEALLDELSGLRERNENLSRELIRADRLVFGKPRNSSGVRI
ncbi:hypothetical protein GL50803_0015219 [Giardia duodenalis]|uniref:Uncharacterized protein n=1 Tax=Giardia intestinalis (strain ATCC 50803 / WB clone C6) TaxID=184922 RepID=A8B758_GIAIC|nr:hypothetical protein GL50803_0015219 [Giardia intestinalis]KAE8301772.1 hypothetical protein GL50803_0015219 [Giardia intestinalis]|eukprot:XP_001709147.1 Hypothetical protein GL50803_15219 [Giardia lamblia ATCC 50803]